MSWSGRLRAAVCRGCHLCPAVPGAQQSSGRRYSVPSDVRCALEIVFDETDIGCIDVIYRPTYVACHLFFIGGRTGSVTRPERIYTNLSEDVFFGLDQHVLHEYYHVVAQWRRERMSRIGYVLRCRRKEQEARAFAAAHLARYQRLRELQHQMQSLEERLRQSPEIT